MRFSNQRIGALIGALVIASFAFLVLPKGASPAGTIVIRGADSGSTLEIGVSGGRLQVDGYLAPGAQQGCRVTRPRIEASCPLGGVGSIVVKMGSSGDFLRVTEKLPVPLTIYLGGGSDKAIANGEPDTCYPGGAKRNRCTLGGGDDTCITGNRNSDCVGGPGADYCEHGRGSDGCWGGPGDDVCVMNAGQDGCHGDAGNDRLYGGPSPDQLYGGEGNDFCDGGRGVGKSHTCERGPGR
jgi:Ca2+-binding RTX toxin-like protein